MYLHLLSPVNSAETIHTVTAKSYFLPRECTLSTPPPTSYNLCPACTINHWTMVNLFTAPLMVPLPAARQSHCSRLHHNRNVYVFTVVLGSYIKPIA